MEKTIHEEELRTAINNFTDEELDKLGLIALDLLNGGNGVLEEPKKEEPKEEHFEAVVEQLKESHEITKSYTHTPSERTREAVELLEEASRCILPSLVSAKINRFLDEYKIMEQEE